MFCPNCGNADQKKNTYCRKCGIFLPDFENVKHREIPPEQHFVANNTLNFMTALVSLGLAITLYGLFFGKNDTHFVIYLTAGFLTAMFFWQVQVIWRTLLLKKQFPGLNKNKGGENQDTENLRGFEPAKTKELLDEADLSDVVPVSVIENTTTKLGEKINRKLS